MKKNKFNAKREVNHIIDKIKQYFLDNTTSADAPAIIGISGGKDSTIAAALLVRALGRDRVIGVLMPNGEQSDIADARRVCDCLSIKSYEIDISKTTNALYEPLLSIVKDACLVDRKLPNAVKTNTPARIRMATLYAIAAIFGGRVINTGNASELYVGYTTKYGDLAGDFAIFKNYYVREILAIGDALSELPRHLVHKAPADGMSGLTDENNLGFSYKILDEYLLDNKVPEYNIYRKIELKHKNNKHKNCINIPAIQPLHGSFSWEF